MASTQQYTEEELREMMAEIREMLEERGGLKRRKRRPKRRLPRQPKQQEYAPPSLSKKQPKAQNVGLKQLKSQSIEVEDGTVKTVSEVDLDGLLDYFGLSYVNAEDLSEKEIEALLLDYEELLQQTRKIKKQKRRLPEPRPPVRPKPPIVEPPVIEPPVEPPIRPPERPIFRPHMHYDGNYKAGGDDDE